MPKKRINATPSILYCPECGCDYTEVERVSGLRVSDEDLRSNGRIYGIPIDGEAGRRGGFAVEVRGECGHFFQIEFVQNKGQTEIQSSSGYQFVFLSWNERSALRESPRTNSDPIQPRPRD